MTEISITEVWEALGGEPPRGSKVRCILPDHDDRRPSASISEVKGLWFCPVCGKGGDAYTLLQEVEGIGFPEAKRRVAELTGIIDDDLQRGPSGLPGYLVPGAKRNPGSGRKYVPAWLRREAGGGS